MAEAPNLLLLMSLTSILTSINSYLVFCKIWATMTFLMWVRHEWHKIIKLAAKTDKSTREMDRQRTSAVNHLRYHCFKQRMKHKHAHKGHFVKPKPLFNLSWKFKALTFLLRAAIFVYLVGCRVERLVGHSYQLLLCPCHLRHRLDLSCRVNKHAGTHAFQSTTASSSLPPFDLDSTPIRSGLGLTHFAQLPCQDVRNALETSSLLRELPSPVLQAALFLKARARSVSTLTMTMVLDITSAYQTVSISQDCHRHSCVLNIGLRWMPMTGLTSQTRLTGVGKCGIKAEARNLSLWTQTRTHLPS